MFDSYSERGRRVIFLARLEAGARGAEMIDVDDLLTALIVEDQKKTVRLSNCWGGLARLSIWRRISHFWLPILRLACWRASNGRCLDLRPFHLLVDRAVSPALKDILAAAGREEDTKC